MRFRLPAYYFLILLGASVCVSFYLKKDGKAESLVKSEVVTPDCAAKINRIRLTGFKFINPTILSEFENESEALMGIKNHVISLINESYGSQKASNVSVYFRSLKDGSWFSVNGSQVYNPASLAKVIYLITYMKEASIYPEIMAKKIYFAKHFTEVNQQNIVTFRLKENQDYTVRDLLYFMMAYSDNDAATLLIENVNQAVFQSVFQDLKVPAPPTTNGEYFIDVAEMSKFFRVIYNSHYLGPRWSEYALELMTHCDYREGLMRGLEPGISFAHKFGERVIGNTSQLHEFGIVYLNDNPYLIGVMSSGNDLRELSDILKEISAMVYQEYSGKVRS